VLANAAEKIALRQAQHAPALVTKMMIHFREYVAEADKIAARRLTELIQQEFRPMTENHYLWDTINKMRNQRLEAKVKALEEILCTARGGQRQACKAVRTDILLAAMKSSVGSDSNESQEVQDMIDMLAAYWKLAMKRFIDEVGMLATDVYTAPKRLHDIQVRLNETFLLDCDDGNLERMFTESKQRKTRRRELLAARERMTDAKQRLEQFGYVQLHGGRIQENSV